MMRRIKFWKYYFALSTLISFMFMRQYFLGQEEQSQNEDLNEEEKKTQAFGKSLLEISARGEESLPSCNKKHNANHRFWHHVKSEYNLTPSELALIPKLECKADSIPDDLWASPGLVGDKFIEQVVWMMEAKSILKDSSVLTPKTIVLWDGANWWNKANWETPSDQSCPKTPSALWENCIFTSDQNMAKTASAVLQTKDWAHTSSIPDDTLGQDTLKITFILESTYHSSATLSRPSRDILASYWRGSDILTPYAKWSYFNEEIQSVKQAKNYSQGKSLPVAMFSSNCGTANDRSGYVKELQKHIRVDVYGSCGPFKCGRFTEGKKCFEKLKNDYYFYLAFENSNCRDYITEKFFNNALGNDVVPIVLGAHPDDYKALAPRNSYIHIEDFESAEALASHLQFLIKTPEEYNRHFEWKGTGKFASHEFFCRVCSLVHYAQFHKPKSDKFKWDTKTVLIGDEDQGNNTVCLDRLRWYWTK